MNGAQQNLTNKEQQKATTKQFLKSKAIAWQSTTTSGKLTVNHNHKVRGKRGKSESGDIKWKI
jgi:hypothetical protein